MIISKVEVKNYRQLKSISLNLQEYLTVIAGPNNSGKTTLSMLLKNLLNNSKVNYTIADVPTSLATSWLKEFFPLVDSIFCKQIPEEGLKELMNSIVDGDGLKKEFSIPSCMINIAVSYNKETDDISNFADYLMDLDEEKSSFYFQYIFELNIRLFEKLLFEKYERIQSLCQSIKKPDCKELEIKKYAIKELLLKIYCDSLIEKCYFCNETFENKNSMELSAFKQLFNLKNIQATRELDDIDSDATKTLSKRIISLLKGNSSWSKVTKKLPETMLANILDTDVKRVIQEASINSLDDAIQKISKTSGGNVGKILLEMDITEEDVDDFIKKVTRAKYDIDGYLLNESSQGLGFSNLIFLHMQLEEYLKIYDPLKVNIFFVEEPESHMHPQMQSVFIRYLLDFFKENKLQGIITSHSNEIAKTVGLSNLRVLRQVEPQQSELFDLSVFKEEIKTIEGSSSDDNTVVLEDFYDFFFEIGYSEIIFADKIILYEGDTERLYIKSLLSSQKFKELEDNYVAYIQVGGAYAYNYKYLIDCLKIKTLIITDIDYNKSAKSEEEINKATSSNSTINKFYKDTIRKKDGLSPETKIDDPTIKKIYDWQKNDENIINNLVYISTQSKNNFPRTLEEAMLCKLLKMNVYDQIKRSEWKKVKKESNLIFTIPKNREGETDSLFDIRSIIESSSKYKTDFMYSVILNGKIDELLPDYIEEGLKWLIK